MSRHLPGRKKLRKKTANELGETYVIQYREHGPAPLEIACFYIRIYTRNIGNRILQETELSPRPTAAGGTL